MNIVILVFLSNIILSVYCDLGEECKTDQGQDGICRTIEKCEQALQDLKRNVRPTICGFLGKETHICCGFKSSYQVGDISKDECNVHNKNVIREIVGGVRAAPAEFPHMVALGYGNEDDIQWNCAGSLISESYVLTAAHCLYTSYHGDVKYIRAGTITLSNPEKTVQDFKVVEMIPHPSYDPPIAYNDIALIKLDKPINNSRSVSPACLQTSFQIDGNLSATGWGYQYYGGIQSNDLMKVNLVQYSNNQCNKSYSRDVRRVPRGIQEELMICAGGERDEERDTCQGDSGGPLQRRTTYYTIVGVTSFGKVCGTPNVPGVYTRVSNYIEWIENIVWKT